MNLSAEWQIFFNSFKDLPSVFTLTVLKNQAADLVVGSQQRETEGHCYRKVPFLNQAPLRSEHKAMISCLPEIPKLIRLLILLKGPATLNVDVPTIGKTLSFISHLHLSTNLFVRSFSRNEH